MIVGPATSQPTDMNNAGVVVGTYLVGNGGINTGSFFTRGNGFVDLGTLGGQSSSVVAINDKGQGLGNRVTASGQRRGFIYYYGKSRNITSTPNLTLNYADINNAGYILARGFIPTWMETPCTAFCATRADGSGTSARCRAKTRSTKPKR